MSLTREQGRQLLLPLHVSLITHTLHAFPAPCSFLEALRVLFVSSGQHVVESPEKHPTLDPAARYNVMQQCNTRAVVHSFAFRVRAKTRRVAALLNK